MSGILSAHAPPGAVPVVGGGGLVPLGTAVDWGVSPEDQGGPWAPPPCSDKSSETCWVFCSVPC